MDQGRQAWLLDPVQIPPESIPPSAALTLSKHYSFLQMGLVSTSWWLPASQTLLIEDMNRELPLFSWRERMSTRGDRLARPSNQSEITS